MNKAITQKVIIVNTNIGSGKEHDPCRTITEVFSEDGELIASYDPLAPTRTTSGQFVIKSWHETEEYR